MKRAKFHFFELDDALIRQCAAGNLAIWEGDGWTVFLRSASFDYAARPISTATAAEWIACRYHAHTGETMPPAEAETWLHAEARGAGKQAAIQAHHAHV